MNTQSPQPAIHIDVDLTNPGQFFACCGLLEIASRLAAQVEGRFENGCFVLSGSNALKGLLSAIRDARLVPLETDVPTTSPLLLPAPIDLCLNWWLDGRAGGSMFKTWAGQQK